MFRATAVIKGFSSPRSKFMKKTDSERLNWNVSVLTAQTMVCLVPIMRTRSRFTELHLCETEEVTREEDSRAMFFKSKIKIEEFATALLQMHASIFGQASLTNICELCGFHFRDETSYAEALWEWLALGLFAVASAVKAHYNEALRGPILENMHKQFYLGLANAGANREDLVRIEQKIRTSLVEYDHAYVVGPIDVLAVQKIFDRPTGILPAKSMQAFEFRIAINEAYSGTLKGANKLFRQFSVVK